MKFDRPIFHLVVVQPEQSTSFYYYGLDESEKILNKLEFWKDKEAECSLYALDLRSHRAVLIHNQKGKS